MGTHSASPDPGHLGVVLVLPAWASPPCTLVLSLTLNWRRRLAISYSRCSSMPRRRHHLREFLLCSDFTWVEIQIQGARAWPARGGDRGRHTTQTTLTWALTPVTGRMQGGRHVSPPCHLLSSFFQVSAPLPAPTGSPLRPHVVRHVLQALSVPWNPHHSPFGVVTVQGWVCFLH